MVFKNKNVVGSPLLARDRNVVCENCGQVYDMHYDVRCTEKEDDPPQPNTHDARGRIDLIPPADTTPYREGVSYIGEAPVGAKLMAFGDKVFMVATSMAPHWVTPTGLVLMQRADGGEN